METENAGSKVIHMVFASAEASKTFLDKCKDDNKESYEDRKEFLHHLTAKVRGERPAYDLKGAINFVRLNKEWVNRRTRKW